MVSSGVIASLFLSLAPVIHSLTNRGQSIANRGSSFLSGNVKDAWEGRLRSPEWIQNVSVMLPVEKIPDPENRTAIVTFAGARNIEYIDGAIMLGISVRKYFKGYPMVAVVIGGKGAGMSKKHKGLLRNAGWHITEVPNWDKEYCGPKCDEDFLGRWHDSFEKINVFRLPFKQVLYLDSDTYIFSDKIKQLVKETELPDGHIAMAMDGCKNESNSGVMLYRPDVSVFTRMLNLVSTREREGILDQGLINEIYRGKIKELPREFNCVDTIGIQPGTGQTCKMHCSENTVVAHFTGHPKPTHASRKLLELVRRPGSPALACRNTNFGSCAKWSDYYCDIRKHSKRLTKDIQYWLKKTGGCCHDTFRDGKDTESCKECPATLDFRDNKYPEKKWPSFTVGKFVKTNMKATKFNGRRPIYKRAGAQPVYLYFVQSQMMWLIGPNASDTYWVYAYAAFEAQCPRDASGWSFYDNTTFVRRKVTVKALPNGNNAPKDTEHVVWNIEKARWDMETMPEGFWRMNDNGDSHEQSKNSDEESEKESDGTKSGDSHTESKDSDEESGAESDGTQSGNSHEQSDSE